MKRIIGTLVFLCMALTCLGASMRISDYPNTNRVWSSNLFLITSGRTNMNVSGDDMKDAIDQSSVKWWDAAGNGVTDDTVAIQNAINQTTNGTIRSLYFPAGTYLVTGEISFAGVDYLLVYGDGINKSIIIHRGNSARSVFSFVGGHRITLRDIDVYSDVSATPPQCVLLCARSTLYASDSDHHFEDVRIRGYATKAVYYNVASEGVVWDKSTIILNGGGATNTVVIAATNELGIAGFPQTMLTHWIENSVLVNYSSGQVILLIQNPASSSFGLVSFKDIFMAGTGGASIRFDLKDGVTCDGPFTFENIRYEDTSGGTNTPMAFYFHGANTILYRLNVHQFHLATYNFDGRYFMYSDNGVDLADYDISGIWTVPNSSISTMREGVYRDITITNRTPISVGQWHTQGNLFAHSNKLTGGLSMNGSLFSNYGWFTNDTSCSSNYVDGNQTVRGFDKIGGVDLGIERTPRLVASGDGGMVKYDVALNTFRLGSASINMMNDMNLGTDLLDAYSYVGALNWACRTNPSGVNAFGVVGLADGGYLTSIGGKFKATAWDTNMFSAGIYSQSVSYTNGNGYGLYIGPISGSGTNWGIYQVGTTNKNYFGGATEVNNTLKANYGGGLNQVGCYGFIGMNATNIVVCAGAVDVYTNVAGTGFTTITTNGFYGNTVANSSALTNLYAGWYRITICLSALGSNNQPLEGEVFTNGVACDLIGFKKTYDAASRMDDMSMTGIIYLPASCRTDFRVQDAGAGGSIAIHRASLTIGTP